MTAQRPGVSTIALLVGDVATLAKPAADMIKALRYFAERDAAAGNIIIVVDGPEWQEWLNHLSDTPATISRTTILTLPNATHLPGLMVNRALALVATDAVGLVAIGTEISTWYANQHDLSNAMAINSARMVAGYRGSGEARMSPQESWRVHQDDQFSSDYPHAWLQMLDLVPMANALIDTTFIRQLGGFTEAPAMQQMWWWEFTLRASRMETIISLPLQPVPIISWYRYPFARTLAGTVGGNLRAMMRIGGERGRMLPIRQDEMMAQPALSDVAIAAQSAHWRALSEPLRHALRQISPDRPLKIAVLGGVNEPAHNQLCFFNYFALMRQWNVLTWQSLLIERATMADIADCDLVIFSRVRSANGVVLMQACAAQKIRTLYMLDDNWFWLGREWHDYAEIFAPGKPDYENFLECVRLADTTLTYSAPLAEDLKPHARRVVTLPTNVDLQMFAADNNRPQKVATIGYVGSLRKNMLAFDALVNIATRRKDVRIFVMSNALPPEFAALPTDQIHFAPYQFNYEAYATVVTNVAPDILVAPVGRTRFEASKCPNKFLEISACGAVGVYSRAEPYLSHVIDGQSGLFADDTLESWVAAIEQLIDAPDTRRQIAARAREQVASHYSTVAVLPQFLAMLAEAVAGQN